MKRGEREEELVVLVVLFISLSLPVATLDRRFVSLL